MALSPETGQQNVLSINMSVGCHFSVGCYTVSRQTKNGHRSKFLSFLSRPAIFRRDTTLIVKLASTEFAEKVKILLNQAR